MSNEISLESTEFEKTVAEMHKLNAETRKLLSEQSFSDKKAKWYELTLIFAAIGLTIAFTKLFL
ncbi:hypothetical protein N7931_17770 [Catenovulum sp. 2E275]|uniref:hypothetical protein n=1 Tax=Catenovulum sp. 2E275 TaxID=2980497 RepID=UPI0021D3D265|nr:hypothetical protein [Catenovulum sp. 2E275]MCU4677474.1 hypothetical protein [Catenovulum sp. 2E275]